MKLRILLASLLVGISATVTAADKRLLWGDTHLHTTYSLSLIHI